MKEQLSLVKKQLSLVKKTTITHDKIAITREETATTPEGTGTIYGFHIITNNGRVWGGLDNGVVVGQWVISHYSICHPGYDDT